MRKDEEHVTVTTTEARSGETGGGHVRTVLIVGVVIAIVGLIVPAAIWSPG